MVSILILTAAIIPMMTMFDTGLKTAVLGGNYDKGRALANKQLEIVKSRSYSDVKNNYPSPPAPAPFDGSGESESINRTDTDPQFSGFTYDVTKQFVTGPGNATTFSNSGTDQGIVRIAITVNWDGKSYRTETYKTKVSGS